MNDLQYGQPDSKKIEAYCTTCHAEIMTSEIAYHGYDLKIYCYDCSWVIAPKGYFDLIEVDPSNKDQIALIP
jgi:hypothetical protein